MSHGSSPVVSLLAMTLFATTAPAAAQNISPATALGIRVGQVPLPAVIDGTTPERWFVAHTEVGRSYCFELGRRGDDENNDIHPALGERGFLGTVRVFRSDASTEIAFGNGANSLSPFGQDEPFGAGLGRACFVQPADTPVGAVRTVYVKVEGGPLALPGGGTGGPGHLLLRAVETTLFCNWYFAAGAYRAFLAVENATDSALSPPVAFLDQGPSGSLAPLMANQTQLIDLAARFGVNGGGSLSLVHNSAPDAVRATVFTLAPSTGVTWSSVCAPRRPW